MICPNFKNKNVFKAFNQMVKAFGGKEMTEDEFRDSALRNERTGSDLIAVEAAYIMFDKNKGNTLDYTPNGEKSVLFQKLLDLFNGDVTKAMIEKSKFYSDSYINANGDWVNSKDSFKLELDVNGEPSEININPVVKKQTELQNEQHSYKLYIDSSVVNSMKPINMVDNLGQEIADKLLNGTPVSSKLMLSKIAIDESFPYELSRQYDLLSKNDIPVIIGDTGGQAATTVVDKEAGNAIIVINKNLFGKCSTEYFITTMLHEVAHSVTQNAINNPVTAVEQRFSKLSNKLQNKYFWFAKDCGLFIPNSVLYALSNPHEMAASFISDPSVKNAMYTLAKLMDKNEENGISNLFKNFVNSLVKLFVNKKIFNSNVENIQQYEWQFYNLLQEQESKNDMSAFEHTVEKSKNALLTLNEDSFDLAKEILTNSEMFDKYNLVMPDNLVDGFDSGSTKSNFDKLISQLYEIRIKSLKTNRNISDTQKTDLLNQAQTIINMFSDPQYDKLSAIMHYLRVTSINISSDNGNLASRMNDLQNGVDKSDASKVDYMDQMHSNYKMHEAIINELNNLMNNQLQFEEIINQYNLSHDKAMDDTRISQFKQTVSNLSEIVNTGIGYLNTIMEISVLNSLHNSGVQSQNQDLLQCVHMLSKNKNVIVLDDVSWFDLNAGASDASSSEIVRAIQHKISAAEDASIESTREVQKRLLGAQSAAKKDGVDIFDFYEKDNEGYPTGLLIRDRNFGQYYADLQDYLSNPKIETKTVVVENLKGQKQHIEVCTSGLNAYINKKYGLNLKPTNGVAPQNSDACVEFNLSLNYWKGLHAERKHTTAYYMAWAKVPYYVTAQVQRIRNDMKTILAKDGYVDKETGRPIYTNFSDEDWKQYSICRAKLKQLRSKYDEFGNLKEEGSEERKIADILTQLHEDLYNGEDNRRFLTEEHAQAREKIIEECGGREQYELWVKNGKKSGAGITFDGEKMLKWDLRNTKFQLKKLPGHKDALVYEVIDQLMHNRKTEYGEEYDKLVQEKRDLQFPARTVNGEIDPSLLTEAVRNRIIEIDKQLREIISHVHSVSPRMAEIAKQRKEISDLLLAKEETDHMRLFRLQATREVYDQYDDSEEAMDDELDLLYSIVSKLTDYEEVWEDYEDPEALIERPYSFMKKTVAISDEYMDIVPSDAWVDNSVNDDKFLNPEFLKLEKKYGVAEVPKMSMYDNSEKYNEAMSKKSAKRLYDLVVQTITEANKMQTNRQYTNPYQISQVRSGLIKAMFRSKHGAWKTFLQWFQRQFGGVSIGGPDSQFDDVWVNDVYYETAEDGTVLNNETVPVTGKYASNRNFNVLRQYNISKLDDPSIINRDLVGITLGYYAMSSRYNEFSKIKDECETILDYVEGLNFIRNKKVREDGGITQETVSGSESNTYKSIRNLLDSIMYGFQKQEIKLGYGKHSIKIHTTLDLYKKYASALNLGLNKSVGIVGFMTSQMVNWYNALTGQKFGTKQWVMAHCVVLKQITQGILSGQTFGKSNSRNKLQLALELMGVSNQHEKKMKDTDRSSILKSIYNNAIYGYMTMTDYLSKAMCTVAILLETRYLDGQFVTRGDLLNDRDLSDDAKLNDDVYKEKLKKWQSAKTLWSLLKVKKSKDGGYYLGIEDQDINAAFNKHLSTVKARCEKTAENADGMATAIQKANFSRTWIGTFVVMHRQYLPLMLQERYGGTVWDNDAKWYKNGVHRNVFMYLAELLKTNLLTSSVIGAALGTYTLGSVSNDLFGASVGAALGVAYNRLNRNKKTTFNQATDKYIDMSSMSAFSSAVTGAALGLYSIGSFTNPVFGAGAGSLLGLYKYFRQKNSNQKLSKDQAQRLSESRKKIYNTYCIKQVMMQLLIYNLVIAPLGAFIRSSADRDKRSYIKQLIALLFTKFQWETHTPHRHGDVLNSIKSVTAATSATDAVDRFFSIFSQQRTGMSFVDLLSLFDGSKNTEYNKKITTGAYRKHTKAFKFGMKLTPFKNEFEQDSAEGLIQKRSYLNNQVYRFDDSKYGY